MLKVAQITSTQNRMAPPNKSWPESVVPAHFLKAERSKDSRAPIVFLKCFITKFHGDYATSILFTTESLILGQYLIHDRYSIETNADSQLWAEPLSSHGAQLMCFVSL